MHFWIVLAWLNGNPCIMNYFYGKVSIEGHMFALKDACLRWYGPLREAGWRQLWLTGYDQGDEWGYFRRPCPITLIIYNFVYWSRGAVGNCWFLTAINYGMVHAELSAFTCNGSRKIPCYVKVVRDGMGWDGMGWEKTIYNSVDSNALCFRNSIKKKQKYTRNTTCRHLKDYDPLSYTLHYTQYRQCCLQSDPET